MAKCSLSCSETEDSFQWLQLAKCVSFTEFLKLEPNLKHTGRFHTRCVSCMSHKVF